MCLFLRHYLGIFIYYILLGFNHSAMYLLRVNIWALFSGGFCLSVGFPEGNDLEENQCHIHGRTDDGYVDICSPSAEGEVLTVPEIESAR